MTTETLILLLNFELHDAILALSLTISRVLQEHILSAKMLAVSTIYMSASLWFFLFVL